VEYSSETALWYSDSGCKGSLGKHIPSGTRSGGPFIVDAHRHGLLTAPALRGGHIQRNHNGVQLKLLRGFKPAGLTVCIFSLSLFLFCLLI
jgi:hypothetical protein